MPQTANPNPGQLSADVVAERTNAFLAGLTALTQQHGIGITGKPTLFLLEPDDVALSYQCDEQSVLFY